MPSPIITPSGPLIKDGKSFTNFSADQSVTWSTNGGELSNIAATTVTWKAPNKTGLWILTADNGPDPVDTVLITVRAIIPNYWEWKNPIRAKKNVLIFRPINGPSQTRGLSDNNVPIREWELGAEDSSFDERNEMFEFWDWHHPGKLFDLIDPVLVERRTFETDSDWSGPYNVGGNSFNWSFRIKEAFPYALVA